MLNAFEWMVAFRYLRSRRREGFISVIAWFSLLGICLGVATLIIVMSVMNGFRHDLLSRILGLNGHITITATGGEGLPEYDPLADYLRGKGGIVSIAPVVEGQVMATAHGRAAGVVVRGIRAADFTARPLLAHSVDPKALEGFDDGDGVLLGRRLAARLGLRVGDGLTLISPKGSATAFGTVPRMRTYRVAGVFEVGMYEYDNSALYMPLSQSQIYFRLGGRVTALEVMVDNPDRAPERAAALRSVLGEGFWVRDWQRVNSTFFNALQVERNVMFLILTLIILVAAFNVISGQIMLVTDKARGIAIMRAMGATRASILRIFFVTGSAIGVIGALAGGALGIAFALNIETIRQWIEGLTGAELFQAEIYFLSKLPARIESTETVLVIVMALVLSFLASLYPAWRAARLDPVEILRYE